MSSGTATGEAAHSGGKGAWAEDEVCWLKGSATANKVTVSATLNSGASIEANVGASMKLNVSVQASINVMTWSLTGFEFKTNVYTFNARGKETAACASVDDVTGALQTIWAAVNALKTATTDTSAIEQRIRTLTNGMHTLSNFLQG